jgi:superfamily II DNA/RNA helicase
VKSNRQTLLFSATLDGDVDVLITRYQRNPVTHSVAVDVDAPKNRHIFWKMDRGERVDVAAKIVNAEWPAIVFCRTKHGADRLAKQLGKVGVSAAAIHGDRSQSQRERALAQFSSGKVQALIATDVAARGIHVDDVAAVVHFDPPGSEKDYVHRSGRTGRAGAAGLVVSLVSDDMQADAKDLQRKLGFEPTLHAPDISALADERHVATPATSVAAPPRPARGAQQPHRQRGRGRRR